MRSLSFYLVFLLGVIFTVVAEAQFACNCVETVTVTAIGTDCPFIPIQVSLTDVKTATITSANPTDNTIISQPAAWTLGAAGSIASAVYDTDSVSTTVTETHTSTRTVTLTSPAAIGTTTPGGVIPVIGSTVGIVSVIPATTASDAIPFVGTDGILHTSESLVDSTTEAAITITVTPVPIRTSSTSSKFPSLIIVGGQGISFSGNASGSITGSQMASSTIWSASTLIPASTTHNGFPPSSAPYRNTSSMTISSGCPFSVPLDTSTSASNLTHDSSTSSTMSMKVSSTTSIYSPTSSPVTSSISSPTTSSISSSTVSSTTSTSVTPLPMPTITGEHGSFITWTPTMTQTGEITIPGFERRFFRPEDHGMTFSLFGTPVNHFPEKEISASKTASEDVSVRSPSTLSTVTSAAGVLVSDD